ncbi:integral membrane protein [Coprinopsis cinerea okayama7|uniref:Integral membrane protein n=1 Tax=Coprinopsis cinerea (strain Okayama-7 / 130 / ATCC MYA-4618 / FGSC 9003) TaxID=240176 RepID=A8NHG6_COPC7|nr:integral membrane protein [Coprinopsis cinerea okayama7\|eukprot:XP_001833755.2 integral membrane protein [Coprinopsis cinerea okayama7\
MPSSLYIPFLLGGMILTGSTNSLWTKWQDMQCVENCSDPDPSKHVLYEQPVWQTLQMFLGEMLCFLPVIYTWLATRNKRPLSPVRLEDDDNQLAPLTAKDDDDKPQQLHGWKVFLLWIPAACDLTGTTLMNIGLLYTPVSIYQMTRGALVLFVGVFSVIFLRRRLWLYQWISLLIVMSGVALVGYSGSLVKHVVQEAIPPPALRSLAARAAMPTVKASESENVSTVLLGVFFVLFAQIFTATQFVVEEKIMGKYAVSPLVAVGYEGLFGAISILLLFPILSIPSVAAKSPFFDLARGWRQMVTTPSVMWSGVAIAISISLFNFFGLSVTRHFLFNNLVRAPPCIPMPAPEAIAAPPSGTAGPSSARARDEEEREGLLSSTLDETAALPADLGQGGYDVVPEGQHAALAVAKSSSGRD